MGEHSSGKKSHKQTKEKKKKKERKKKKKDKKQHKHEEECVVKGSRSSEDNVSSEQVPSALDREPSPIPSSPKLEDTKEHKLQREDWMVKPMARPHTKPPPEDVEGSKIEDKGWGVALDEAKRIKDSIKPANTDPAPIVGDGGASWRLKALKKMKMRAENEGLSLREVAESRGWDLAELMNSATQRTAAAAMSHLSESRRRAARHKGQSSRKEGGHGSHGLDDVRSDKSRMKRPVMDERLSLHSRRQPQRHDGHSDAYAKKAGAIAINRFENDGSFFSDYFRGKEKDSEQQKQKDESPGSEKEARQRQRQIGKDSEDQRKPQSRSETVAMGNESAAEILRKQLGSRGAIKRKEGREEAAEIVQLPLVGSKGRAAPGAFGREKAQHSERPKRKGDKHHSDGSRKRYSDDEDDVDLNTLVRRSRHGDDAIDMDKAMAARVMGRKNYKQSDFDADAEYDFDVGTSLSSGHKSKRKRQSNDRTSHVDRAQVNDFKRLRTIEESCMYCFSCPRRPKHLVVSIATTAYMMLPSKRRLVPGHCLILPLDHTASTRQLDENVLTEMRNFKKALIQMFHSQGKQMLFMETAVQLGSFKQHAIVHCIPVSPREMSKAPLYFKNAIDAATEDWAQHHNKRCISTKDKGLQRSIPENFPYFHVEFGLADGFVHVIDDESKFDKDMGWKVICGLLKLPAEVFHQKNHKQGHVVEEDWVAEFASSWAAFDWTLALQ